MVRKLILVSIFFLLAACLLFSLCLKDRIDELWQRFSSLVEHRLGEVVGQTVTIRAAKVGLFNNLVIEGLSILPRSEPDGEPVVKVEKVALNYRLWDMMLGRFDRPRLIKLLSPTLSLKGTKIADLFMPWRGPLSGEASVLICDGKLNWQSPQQRFRMEIEPIYGTVEFFSSKAARISLSSRGKRSNFDLWGQTHPGNGTYNLTLRLCGLTLELPSVGDLRVDLSGELFGYAANSQLDVSVRAKNRYLETTFDIKGELPRPHLDGSFSLADRFIIPFQGNIDFRDRIFALALKLNHLRFDELDVTTELSLEGGLVKKEDGTGLIAGEISTKNSIIDYKPFKELLGSYLIEEGILKIPSLALGDSYRLTGAVELTRPFLADLTIWIDGADMMDLLVFCKDIKEDALSGRIEGEFRVKGPLASPQVMGRCLVKDGNFGDLEYGSMWVDLEGKGRVIAIKDSKIYQKEGFLTMEGEIDLARANVCEGVKIISCEERVVWRGWDITKPWDSLELKMGKTVGEDFRINFKTYLKDELSAQATSRDEVALEYKLNDSESIKIHLREDEEVLGVEHKFKF